MAKESAQEHNLHYGMSALDGKWYVGSPEELKKAGCANIDKSEGKMSKAMEIVKSLSEEVDEDTILKELIDTLGVEFEEEIRGSFKTEGRYGSFGDAGEFTADGTDYNWIASEDEAERIALEIVKNDLEEQPEIFNQKWLQGFMSISDTDKRLIADDMVVMEAESQNFKDDKAREKWIEKRSQEIEGELDDPVEYFVNQQGIYSIEDLMKQDFMRIDTEAAAEDSIRQDGWAHFLSHYSGDYDTTKNGVVYFREN